MADIKEAQVSHILICTLGVYAAQEHFVCSKGTQWLLPLNVSAWSSSCNVKCTDVRTMWLAHIVLLIPVGRSKRDEG